MRHDVGDAAGRLVGRQRAKERRILHRELRANMLAARAALEHAIFLGHHGVAAALGTGSRNRLHHANRERARRRGLAIVKIPEIAIVERTHGNGLGAINRGAAAHRKDKVNAVLADNLDALVHERIVRVRLHAAEFHVRDANSIEASLHAVDEARTHRRATTVMDQHLRAAILLDKRTAFIFAVHAEYKFRGAVEIEIFHIPSFFLFFA